MSTVTALDDFTLAYIECMLWTEEMNLGGKYDISAIHPTAIEEIAETCGEFQKRYEFLLERVDYESGHYTDEELCGHDFWLTRNGHGVGFWDRGLGELGEHLTTAAESFGECWPYIGDDGKIYV